jgi:hypothetical protein
MNLNTVKNDKNRIKNQNIKSWIESGNIKKNKFLFEFNTISLKFLDKSLTKIRNKLSAHLEKINK